MSVPDYVVRIGGKTWRGSEFNGSGFLVTDTGLIATCLHVAMPEGKAPLELWAEFTGMGRWKCSLANTNAAEDLATIASVVPIGAKTPFLQLDLGWRNSTKEGDQVSVWGYSAADNYALAQQFTLHVSGFAGKYARIGLDGTINSGDSGGPVVNREGLCIGVTQLKDKVREGQAMAIPVSYLSPLLPVRVLGANPYRGLEYFDVEHRAFFGREELVEELLNKLTAAPGAPENRFLGMVGPVGSGKSSLARAGLLASIREGRLRGSERWPVAICRPGTDPLENLAIALAKTHKTELTPAAIRVQVQEFRASDRTLKLSSRLALTELFPDHRVVLLVDQFEEVFTQCRGEADRKAFIDNLVTAATDPAGQTIVLLTLRADFYGECANHPRLAATLAANQVLVGPMREAELRRAIECPAREAGAEFEHGLVDLLLDEVRGQPGSLPLLQYSLSELWQFAEGNKLTHAAYQAIGRVAGAVERRAEEVYRQLNQTEQVVLRRILQRLVQSTGSGKAARRRVRLEDLLPAEGDAEQVQKVINRMADAPVRLLVIEDSGRVVDIAHEALIQHWGRLGQWLDEDKEFQLWQKRLNAALVEWDRNARHPDALLRGKLLIESRDWLQVRRDDLNRAEREFILAGAAAEKARVQKELRVNRNLKILVSVLTVLVVAAAAMAVYARHEAQVARSLALAAASEANIADADLALILSIHAFSSSDTPEAEQALYQALRRMRAPGFPASSEGAVVLGMAYSPARHLLATANSDSSIALWDVDSKERYGAPIRIDGGLKSLSFVPKAQGLAVATLKDGIQFISLSGESIQPELKLPVTAEMNTVEFSPTGDSIVVGTRNPDFSSAISTYPATSFRQLKGQAGPVTAAKFIGADGKALLTASAAGTLAGWDVGSIQKTFTLEARADAGETTLRPLLSLAVSPDGVLAAAGDASGTIHIWDLRSHQLVQRLLHSKGARVQGLAFSADGRLLASAGQDGAIKLWTVKNNKFTERVSMPCGKPLAPGKTDLDGCTALLFSDDHTLEAADRDGDTRRYETDTTKLLAQARSMVDTAHLRPETGDGCKKYLRQSKCSLP